MCFSLMPVAAFAEEEAEATTEDTAFTEQDASCEETEEFSEGNYPLPMDEDADLTAEPVETEESFEEPPDEETVSYPADKEDSSPESELPTEESDTVDNPPEEDSQETDESPDNDEEYDPDEEPVQAADITPTLVDIVGEDSNGTMTVYVSDFDFCQLPITFYVTPGSYEYNWIETRLEYTNGTVLDTYNCEYKNGSWSSTYDYSIGKSITHPSGNTSKTPQRITRTFPVGYSETQYKLYVRGATTGKSVSMGLNWNSGWNSCTIKVIDNRPSVSSIQLDKTELEMNINETSQLSVSYSPSNAKNRSCTWSSLDSGIATVSADGLVTAVGEGTTTITAKSYNGKTASCAVSVIDNTVKVEKIEFDQNRIDICQWDTARLNVIFTPENATIKTVTWVSSDPSIATVSDGIVTAVGAGTALITAQSYNGKTASCEVFVTPDPKKLYVIDKTNFPSDSFRNIVTGFDIDGNSYLGDTEIAAVKTLDCSSKGISSLVGIEVFTSLTELNCSSNYIESLDVSSLTSLTTLDCSRMNVWLTSLNVSNLTSLTTLDCHYNSLKSLDVSDLTSLTVLDCNYNEFASLDVSSLTFLTVLDCGHNNLTSLNVSGLTSLISLKCDNNKLTSLDVSGLTSLTTLNCSSNKLTSLDASGLMSLTTLNCSLNSLTSLNVSGLTSLTTLDCNQNKLTNLNVSDLISLTALDCYRNSLTSLDVGSLTFLTSLNCGENCLTGLDVSNLSALGSLNCTSNKINTLYVNNCRELCDLACAWNNLSSLNIGGCPELINVYRNGNRTTSTYNSHKTIEYKITQPADGYTKIIADLYLDASTHVVTETLFAITTQPNNCTVQDGKTAAFRCNAVGDNLTYQWQTLPTGQTSWRNTDLEGNNSNLLSFTAKGVYNNWKFRCAVKDGSENSLTTNDVTLTVTPKPAREIHVGETLTAVIGYGGDTDSFVFVPEKTGTYLFASRGDRDTCGSLCDADRNVITDNDNDGEGNNFKIRFKFTAGVTYYLVARYNDEETSGSFSVELICAHDMTELCNVKAATCSETGYTGDEVCSICGETVNKGTVIAKLAHTPGKAVRENEKAATCTAEGSYDEVVYCKVCHEELSRVKKTIEKIPHEKELVGVKEPTVAEEGYTGDLVCKFCGKVFEQGTVIPALWFEMPEELSLNKSYILMTLNGNPDELTTTLKDEALRHRVRWTTDSGKNNVISVMNGIVTAEGPGMDYVVATLSNGEESISAQCRVDVLNEEKQRGTQITASLPVTKLTTELLKTDYARIPVVLILKQNNMNPADVKLSDGKVLEDTGVMIDEATFIGGGKADIRKAFGLRVADDRTLELVPIINVKDKAAVKAVAGSYKSAIHLVLSDGTETDTAEVTVTVKKSQPKLTVKAVTVNGFISGQTVPVEITGGTVRFIPAQDLGFATLNSDLTVTVKNGVTQSGSKTVTLNNVELEDWAVPTTLKITVKNQYKAPKITLKPTTVTVNKAHSDVAAAEAAVTPLEGMNHVISASGVSGLNAWYDRNTECVMVSAGSATAGKTAYKVPVKADGKPVAYLNVKVVDGTPSITTKVTGTINPNLKNSPAIITVTGKNYNAAAGTYTVTIQQNGSDVDPELFQTPQKGNMIYVTAGTKTPADGKYTAIVSCAEAGAAKAVTLTVKTAKAPAMTATLKAAGSIDILRGTGQITVTPTIKNKYDYDESKLGLKLPKGLTWEYKNGKFIVTAIPGENINPATKTATLTLNGTAISKPVTLTLKQGKATVNQSTKEITLSKNDRFDRQSVILSLSDSTLYDIGNARVTMTDSSGYLIPIPLGNGEYAIGYMDNKLPANVRSGKLKSTTVKFNVYLQGNGGNKANATLSVKVNFG